MDAKKADFTWFLVRQEPASASAIRQTALFHELIG
jgi:hypothetical protein